MRRLYFYIIILILTNTANGFDGSMMNGLQTLSYWRDYFDHPEGSILGLFNASMSLGSLIGLPFVPYLVDWRGRKVGIILGCVIMLLAVGLQSGAQNFGMFIAARLLLGFGDCIVLGSAPLLIAEISHPQDRAILVTLSGASYHSGAFIASWTTYGTLQIKVGSTCQVSRIFAYFYDRTTGRGGFPACSKPFAPSLSWLSSGGFLKARDGTSTRANLRRR